MASKRAAVAVVGCLIVGLIVEGHRPPTHAPAASVTAVVSANLDPVYPSPPDLPPPIETPYRVVLAALPREAYPDVQQNGSTVRIRYRIDPSMMSVAMGRRAFDQNVVQLVPDLFARFPTISTVEISADAATKDIRGGKARASAADVEFSRRNAQGIHWGAIDTGNIERLADRAWYDSRFR